MAESTPRAEERPGAIDAVPVRHPGRMVAVVVVILIALMLIDQLLHNQAFDWSFTWAAMQQPPVIDGFIKGTLIVTVLAMLFGVALGIVLSIMRLSPNPILRGVAFAYTWFFRAIPRYVLLTLLGAAGAFFPSGMIPLGIPYGDRLMSFFGIDATLTWGAVDANQLFTGLLGAALGLGLSEAAYMAEIARSGIISVDRGQTEAAQALGMSRSQAMTRIVLPQAMRVIVPPTGNETIAMFKDTSLLSAIPLATELFFQLNQISTQYYKPIPSYVAATIYYLLATTVLMIGQAQLENHFGRGYAPSPSRRNAAKANDTTAVDFPGSDH
ncbi:amino acid ABC transporter permease [Nigerium massiliense]|uniref:amino acid ABC transporter permease n=1 Tax=Nigerium massiliense TaxID=1522317 RepID=UPI0006936AEA|nr:amino acid ABC transporter permease [Nigerium massiliense]